MLESQLGVETPLTGHAAVMGADLFIAELIGQRARQALGHAPCIDEHQRTAMLLDELNHARTNLARDFGRDHGFERRPRHFDGQIPRSTMPFVDNGAGTRARVIVGLTGKEFRHPRNRALRCRQANTQRRTRGQRVETRQAQGQVRTAFVADQRVYFVDYYCAHRTQHRPSAVAGQQDVERFGCRDQNMRRALAHQRARRSRRVTGAHRSSDGRHLTEFFGQQLLNSSQRLFEIALDVVAQRLERRHVQHHGFRCEFATPDTTGQLTDRGQEGGECLARASRCRHQRVTAGRERRPGTALAGRRSREARAEPARHSRIKRGAEHGLRLTRSHAPGHAR